MILSFKDIPGPIPERQVTVEGAAATIVAAKQQSFFFDSYKAKQKDS